MMAVSPMIAVLVLEGWGIQRPASNKYLAAVGLTGAFSLLPRPLPVFVRGDERLDHLGLDELAAELVELLKPELGSNVL
jgi:hypothetical protein